MAPKVLVAFDFDHTVVDCNSDFHVRKLAPNGVIPEEIKNMLKENSWTHLMRNIFLYLHEQGVKPDVIVDFMRQMPLVKDMKNVLDFLRNDKFETIVISDSNSLFIETSLRHFGHFDQFNRIYTNPAQFNDEGCLSIQEYHFQDWCKLSTENLCKGAILDDHIAERGGFETVVYIGDGTNDLCPGLRLRKSDLLLPRVGFALEKALKNESNPRPVCQVRPWSTGQDILHVLSSLS